MKFWRFDLRGFRSGKYCGPPILFAGLVSLALVPFNTQLTPKAMGQFRSIYHKIAQTDPLQIEAKKFVAVRNVRLYAGEVEKEHKQLKEVWLYRLFPDYTERVHAPQGKWEVNDERLSLTLLNGQIERFGHSAAGDFMHIAFKKYGLSVPLQPPGDSRNRNWREFTTPELRREITRRSIVQLPIGELRSEYHLRFSLAFAPMALALIGIPLGMTIERGGRGVGFGAAVVVLFFYYLLLVMGMNLADRESIPAVPALWMANSVAVLVGLTLFRKRLSS